MGKYSMALIPTGISPEICFFMSLCLLPLALCTPVPHNSGIFFMQQMLSLARTTCHNFLFGSIHANLLRQTQNTLYKYPVQ